MSDLLEHFFNQTIPAWLFIVLIFICLFLLIESILIEQVARNAEMRALRAENALKQEIITNDLLRNGQISLDVRTPR